MRGRRLRGAFVACRSDLVRYFPRHPPAIQAASGLRVRWPVAADESPPLRRKPTSLVNSTSGALWVERDTCLSRRTRLEPLYHSCHVPVAFVWSCIDRSVASRSQLAGAQA